MYKLGDRCDELDISFWDNFQYRFSQMIDFIDIYEVKFGCVAYDSDRLKKFQLFRINTRFHINLIHKFLLDDIDILSRKQRKLFGNFFPFWLISLH